MKTLLKITTVLSLFLISLYTPTTLAGIDTVSEAINQAGRQRMLSQRMYKAWVMKGIDVSPDKAQGQLDAAIKLFDKQLADLITFAPNKKIVKGLRKVQKQWASFKKEIVKIPNKDVAIDLLDENDELLRRAHKVVLMLQDASGKTSGKLINVSGRQRMLSQRMAKFYMLKSWGLKNSIIEDELTRAKNEFQGALTELKAAELNTVEISRYLKTAQKEWNLMKHGLEKGQTQTIPLIVFITSDKLLKTMNTITGLYTEL